MHLIDKILSINIDKVLIKESIDWYKVSKSEYGCPNKIIRVWLLNNEKVLLYLKKSCSLALCARRFNEWPSLKPN